MDLLQDVSMTLKDIHNAPNNELVRENLRRILARNAIHRGIRWIEKHADSPGWWRNCLNKGKSRVRTGYSSEGILALVFEYRAEFADQLHYINEGKITRHFGITLLRAERCGFLNFMGGWKPFPKQYPAIVISHEDIDRAWADFLEHPPGDWLLPAKHWPPLPEFVWDKDASLLSRRTRLLRLRDRIFIQFKKKKQTT